LTGHSIEIFQFRANNDLFLFTYLKRIFHVFNFCGLYKLKRDSKNCEINNCLKKYVFDVTIIVKRFNKIYIKKMFRSKLGWIAGNTEMHVGQPNTWRGWNSSLRYSGSSKGFQTKQLRKHGGEKKEIERPYSNERCCHVR